MSKQDRQGVRTPVDLERKYSLGSMKKKFSEVEEISAGAKDSVAKFARELRQELNEAVNNINGRQNAFDGELDSVNQQIGNLITEVNTIERETAEQISTLGAEVEAVANESNKKISDLGTELATYKSATNQSINTLRSDHEAYEAETDQKIEDMEGMLESTQRTANEAFASAMGVVNDINDHFLFEEGGTRILGAVVTLLLPAGTDLDGVILPNKYRSGNVATSGYLNCPVTSGTFALEVESCGDQGQLLQRLTYSNKTNGKTYERVFYQDGWGQWVLVSDYSGAALKAIQTEVDTLEASLNKHKTDTATRLTEAEGDIGTIGDSVDALDRTVQVLSADIQGVINDVNDHFDFNEGGMTIKGAINPLLIPAGTDLNSLLIPNKYIGGVVTEYKYLNCPITTGTFSFEVESCGIEGQLRQRLTYCSKTNSKTYERFSYGVDWGEWVVVTDFVPAESGKLLWDEGVYYMTATQTANLSEAVSKQKNGIVLVFSEYANGAASDTAFHCFFVPKTQVAAQPGKDYIFTLATSKFAYMATKCVYIHDTKIVGHADNNQTGSGTSGITFTNNRFVLRYVFGI